MRSPWREGRQLNLFEHPATAAQLDQALWYRSFESQQSSLQRLATYAHQPHPATVQVLIDLYSQPGDVVLDPFSGAGTIAFEAAIANRVVWANDLNPYAYTITRGKLEAPASGRLAAQSAIALLNRIEPIAAATSLDQTSAWVQAFFHPDTLREVIAAFADLNQSENYFLQACLLGILHHIRPGFLSYPTNQAAPYLRRATYPPEQVPQMYAYRDLRSRLLSKIRRLYRHHHLPNHWTQRQYQLWQSDAATLSMGDRSVDAIITAPPHVGAFSYVRDNRLRLWFLGYPEWQALDGLMISQRDYTNQMAACFRTMARVLKPQGYCILVISSDRSSNHREIASTLATLAIAATEGAFAVETIYEHVAASKRGSAIAHEQILVLQRR